MERSNIFKKWWLHLTYLPYQLRERERHSLDMFAISTPFDVFLAADSDEHIFEAQHKDYQKRISLIYHSKTHSLKYPDKLSI